MSLNGPSLARDVGVLAFPGVTAHSLRHTAASLAISSGANVKVVQRMLGHASAAMTLGTYADLFEADLDTVAENVGMGGHDPLTDLTEKAPTCAYAGGGFLPLVSCHVPYGAIAVH
jgi:hypothetical protein